MDKAQISQGYIKDQKNRYLEALGSPQAVGANQSLTAIVVGSDLRENIGAHIARRLKADGFGYVLQPTVSDLDVTDSINIQGPWFKSNDDADTLVLAHGVNEMAWFEDARHIADVINVNLTGTAVATQAFVQATLDKPYHKTIVMIGSMAYNNVLNASAAYCASKAGLAMLARCLAWELAPKGYTVVAVHPSNTEGTPMTEATIQGLMAVRHITRQEAEAYWGAVLPKERWLQPEDIADVVSFVVRGGAGGYLSGANIELRGGQR